MPEIKYTGAPTQTPEEARRTAQIPEYRLDFPHVQLTKAGQVAGEAIGEATKQLGSTMHTLGASIDSLGRTMSGAGDELFQRALGIKQLEAETKVNNATIAWEQAQIKKDEEFYTKKGDAANSSALDAHLKSSEADRQKFRSQMGSQQEQKMFDQQTTRAFLQMSRAAARHSHTEVKEQALKTSEIKVDTIKNRVISATEDADKKAALAEGIQEIHDNWRYVRGANAEQVKAREDEFIKSALFGSAQRMSDKGDPQGAIKFLEDNKEKLEKLDAAAYAEVYKKLSKDADDIGERAAADKAIRPDSDEHPDEARARLDEELKRTGRDGDLKYRDNAYARLNARLATMAHDRAVAHTQSRNEITKALYGHAPGQQGVPKTPEELRAGVKEEDWKAMSEQEKEEFNRNVLRNAMEVLPTPANQLEFRRWQGLLVRDPKQVLDQEAQTPGFIDKLEIPLHQRDLLTTMLLHAQQQGDKVAGDFRVAQAWRYAIDHNLIAERLQRKGSREGDQLHAYIAESMNAWVAMHKGKAPTGDDYTFIINQATRHHELEKDEKSSVYYGKEPPEYKKAYDTSDPEFKKFKKQYLDVRKGASDEEVTNAWLQQYARKRLEKEEKAKSDQIKAKRAPTVQSGG